MLRWSELSALDIPLVPGALSSPVITLEFLLFIKITALLPTITVFPRMVSFETVSDETSDSSVERI